MLSLTGLVSMPQGYRDKVKPLESMGVRYV